MSENRVNQLVSMDSPFSLHNDRDFQYPLLISVPHAGRVYPEEIYRNLAVPAAQLLRLEDRYADRLAVSAIVAGFTTIVAQRPRAWIDLNRSEKELDPDMITGLSAAQLPHPSRKVRGGLGIVPRRLTGAGNLWRDKWSRDDVEARIAADHAPYHQAIAEILKQMRDRFGAALLLDLHSMPPLDNREGNSPQIVIGDRFGRSCDSRYAGLSEAYFQQHGMSVRLNHPYAGGYILDRHADVPNNIHALQLEVDRALYLDKDLREPGANIDKIASGVSDLAAILANQINSRFQLIAAE